MLSTVLMMASDVNEKYVVENQRKRSLVIKWQNHKL